MNRARLFIFGAIIAWTEEAHLSSPRVIDEVITRDRLLGEVWGYRFAG